MPRGKRRRGIVKKSGPEPSSVLAQGYGEHIRATRVTPGPVPLDEQNIDFLFVLDVEASCVKDRDPDFVQEIIELPVVCVDTRGRYRRRRAPEFRRRDRLFGSVVSEFRTFVRPELNPELSRYCTKLTGIENSDVDDAPVLREALQQLHAWVDETILRYGPLQPSNGSIQESESTEAGKESPDPGAATGGGGGAPASGSSKEGAKIAPVRKAGDAVPTPSLGAPPVDPGKSHLAPAAACLEEATSLEPCVLHGQRVAFVTDGPWDLLYYMHEECEHKAIPKPLRPGYLDKWVNLRWLHAEVFNRGKRQGVSSQLHSMGLRFQGREHSGIDDSRNIARIAMAMMGRGCRMCINDGVVEGVAVKWTPPSVWNRAAAKPVPPEEYPPSWYGGGAAYESSVAGGEKGRSEETLPALGPSKGTPSPESAAGGGGGGGRGDASAAEPVEKEGHDKGGGS